MEAAIARQFHWYVGIQLTTTLTIVAALIAVAFTRG
jgi:hypothetical protein